MTVNLTRIAALALIGASLSGCASEAPADDRPVRAYGILITDDHLCRFRIGMTTIPEVKAILGPPDNGSTGCFHHLFLSTLQYDFDGLVAGEHLNEATFFDFDPAGLLTQVRRVRIHSGTTMPLPACLRGDASAIAAPPLGYPCPPADAGNDADAWP
jgi:hypothetical protein